MREHESRVSQILYDFAFDGMVTQGKKMGNDVLVKVDGLPCKFESSIAKQAAMVLLSETMETANVLLLIKAPMGYDVSDIKFGLSKIAVKDSILINYGSVANASRYFGIDRKHDVNDNYITINYTTKQIGRI